MEVFIRVCAAVGARFSRAPFEIHINPEKKMKQIPAAQEGVGGAETEKFSKPKKGKKKFGIPAAQETA